MYIAKMVIGSPPNPFAEFLRMMTSEPLPLSTAPVEVDAVLSTPGYHPAEPFPPFTEPVEFQFDEQVNLFVGPNATGKSNLLANLFERLANGIQGILDTCNWGLLEIPEPHRHLKDLALIAIPATRIGYGSGQPGQALIRADSERVIVGSLSAPIYAESVQRFLDEVSEDIDELWSDKIDILSEQFGIDPESLVRDIHGPLYDGLVNHYNLAQNMFEEVLRKSFFCAKEICNEVIAGNSLHSNTIVRHGYSMTGLPVVSTNVEIGTRVKTTDPAQRDADAQPLAIEQLSAGTEGTLWWIRLIALCLLKAADYQFAWEDHPAILFIDEIENHLHPTWQRRVIPTLLKYFPGLQIFATTHSPFVVAGLKAGQVHILRRDADSGVITASTNTEDIVGWTMDEILRAFMGVADPTDDATAAAAHELRQLRSAGPAADAPDEERRQTRMQHLRRQVDRDLLAGGPKARRREEFAQQFSEALEKRRQAQSLNQDGG